MFRNIISDAMKSRLLPLLIKMLLPPRVDLNICFKSALFAVTAFVAGGFLIACTIAIIIIGLFYILYSQGDITATQAFIMTISVMLIIVSSLFAFGYYKVKNLFSSSMQANPVTNNDNHLNDVINGFIEGLVKRQQTNPSSINPDDVFSNNKTV